MNMHRYSYVTRVFTKCIGVSILIKMHALLFCRQSLPRVIKSQQKIRRSLISGVDDPERSGTPIRYLLFSRNARSGTYSQINRNAFYLPFWHLFTMEEMMIMNL